jgi:hypothetical protein
VSSTSWSCVIDPTRPCGCCAAPSQDLCPYPYLLADEPADRSAIDDRPDHEPDRTSRESEAFQARRMGPSALT